MLSPVVISFCKKTSLLYNSLDVYIDFHARHSPHNHTISATHSDDIPIRSDNESP